MATTAAEVKALREKTGAGMMDCKNALDKANGDFAGAERILKELGVAAAQKRSGRDTKEGCVFTIVDGKRAAILELLCETDFVAQNEGFAALGKQLVQTVLEKDLREKTADLDTMVEETIARIKENMGLGRFEILQADENEQIVEYVHGAKVGVLVKLRAENTAVLEDERFKTAAFDCALHAAAFAPLYLARDDVETAYVTEQEEIFTAQAEKLGKPENVVQGIVKGKLKKHLMEICFLEQMHVRETKKSVATVLSEVGKEMDTTITISEYRYYKLGES